MSHYKHSVMLRCPVGMKSDANHLAACWGESMADLRTYDKPENYAGYVVLQTVCTERLLQRSAAEPVRPEHDTESVIDLEAAARAKSRLVVIMPGEEAPEFGPDDLVAVVDMPLEQAIEMLGLEPVAEMEEALAPGAGHDKHNIG